MEVRTANFVQACGANGSSPRRVPFLNAADADPEKGIAERSDDPYAVDAIRQLLPTPKPLEHIGGNKGSLPKETQFTLLNAQCRGLSLY